MAHLVAEPIAFIDTPGRALATDPLPTEAGVRETGDFLLPGLTIRLPVTLEPRASIGAEAGYATIDDYYETIHVRPALLDIGRITASVRREVEVWNAYRGEDRTLQEITVTAGDGIEVSGVDLPFTLGTLESTVFTVDVTPEGPATIGARYDLEFTTPERDPNWQVEGVRIIEWTIPPNWSSPFEETWEFKTEVLESFSGKEQRIALRHRPRRYFGFQPLTSGDRDRTYKRLLSTWQNRTYAMADWPRGVPTNGVPAGGRSVLLHGEIEGLAAGDLLVLRHRDTSQVIEVDEIDGDLVRLNSPVLQAFPAGTMAYRGLTLHADPQLSARRFTSVVGQLSARFREMHVAEPLDVPAAPVLWRDTEVLEKRPNWRENIDLDHHWHFAWLDTNRGAFDYRTPHDAPKDVRRYTFTLRSREEVAALRDVFVRARGRRGELFVPTWDGDLVIRPDTVMADGTTRLPLVEVGEATRMVSERVYRNVCVRLTDGTRLYRHITAGDFDSAGPVLVVDEGWPRNIESHEVLAIHWMPRCRFASDELAIRWITAGVAEASVGFQVLEDIEEGDL